MILPTEIKTCATQSGPGPRSGRAGLGNLYQLPLPFDGNDQNKRASYHMEIRKKTNSTKFCFERRPRDVHEIF